MISFVVLIDHISKRSSKLVGIIIPLVICAIFTASFLFFADFAFGMSGNKLRLSRPCVQMGQQAMASVLEYI